MKIEYTDRPDVMVPKSIIDRISELASRPEIAHVHYIGWSDKDLIIALKGAPGVAVSVMDMYNRTNHETHFWDEDGSASYEDYPVPEWMTGTTVHFDGAPPRIDLALWDIPWDSPDQLDRILRFRKNRLPKIIALFGKADLTTDHDWYEWLRDPDLTIGYLKDALPSDPP
mgnify:CR=1 FL=1